MLSEIFKALLITSLAGLCLAAVITIVKPATKKVFGYSWHYYIWLAVLTVMILPVRFTLSQKTDIPPVTVMQSVQTEQMALTVQNTGNIVSDAQTKPQTDIWQAETSLVKRIIDNRLNILAYLWLAGMILLLSVNLAAYINLIIKMRKNSVVVSCPEIAEFTRREITARVWENTSSPFMVGIFKPTLVLPAIKLTEEQLVNILRHEMTHFRRHDILYKWFAVLTGCVHWFNPVIWYVIKQINTECEISCDMAVTLNMNADEEMSYIDTVLSLLTKGKTKQIPLTTQMASSKRVLKRRFEMIRHKRRTSKFVSALSAMLAVVMLGTTVFASGVLSDLTTDDYTVEIANYGDKIELINKPFIENGEVYVPLREILENRGYNDTNSYINWNNGTINIGYLGYPDTNVLYQLSIGKTGIKLMHFISEDLYEISIDSADVAAIMKLNAYSSPVLKGSVTYVPLKAVNYMLYGFLDIRTTDGSLYELTYSVYDKNGNLIDTNNNLSVGTIIIDENNTVVYKGENLQNPESTITSFFEAFENSNFTLMKNYCTKNCIDNFFGDNYVFGMKKATLQSISKDSDDLRKRGFVVGEWAALVNVTMTPDENSVYEPNQTATSFYLILKQQNGRYLIDEFATGL